MTSKSIELRPSRRDVQRAIYGLTVTANSPEDFRNRLEVLEIRLMETELTDDGTHRLILSVAETPNVSAEHRLDTAVGVLADRFPEFSEIHRERLEDGEVREVEFEMVVECRFPDFDVRRHLELAAGIQVKQARSDGDGRIFCRHCGSDRYRQNIKSNTWQAPWRCEDCESPISGERLSKQRILSSVRETPGILAEERLEPVLSVIRGSAQALHHIEVRRINDIATQTEELHHAEA